MSHLEPELNDLRESLLEMMTLVRRQLEKVCDATMEYNYELAQEVIAKEKRVNGNELKIDKDCENALALYNPVAIDLRFVLASLKINSNLERIGDNAASVAQFVCERQKQIDSDLLLEFQVKEMFEHTFAMLKEVALAMEHEDSNVARRVFKLDKFLNDNNVLATQQSIELIQKQPNRAPEIIPILSIVRKLERVGDLSKNMAEEIIFYLEAKVLKHNKKKRSETGA